MLKASPPATRPRVDHPLIRAAQRRSVALLVAAAVLNYFDRSDVYKRQIEVGAVRRRSDLRSGLERHRRAGSPILR